MGVLRDHDSSTLHTDPKPNQSFETIIIETGYFMRITGRKLKDRLLLNIARTARTV
jgi:hypothetical protein